MSGTGTGYLLERAWVDGEVRDDVLVTVRHGRFTAVVPGWSRTGSGTDQATGCAGPPDDGPSDGDLPSDGPGAAACLSPGDVVRLPGLTLPGLANCHSHAFHRALRGRTQRGTGSFWTWRDQMYALAARLDPDSYHRLARAAYREMAAAGITTVGEFHYLHHRPDGTRYADPNAMGQALVAAAHDAGVRLALLDTCYLSAGVGREPEGVQRAFADRDAGAWAARVAALDSGPGLVVGGAVHSVRAVPRDQLAPVVAATEGRPWHAHVSEQVAENQQCLAAYDLTPVALLDEAGAWGPAATAVHATHLTETDVAVLGAAGASACFCPTTERDLGDGVGPSRALRAAGARLTLGSDSHAVVDLFEEMRAVELDERLVAGGRGHWPAAQLLTAATRDGHASLGFGDAGAIAVGCRADLVTVDTGSVRTAGTGRGAETAVFAATAADVSHVVVDGRTVVARHGNHGTQEIGAELARAVAEVWEEDR